MKPLACVLRLNCISLHSPFLHSAESLFKMHDNEKLHFCNYRCKILYDSICKQGEFISLYSCMWNPAVQFVCAACSIKHLSFQALICPTDCHLSLIEEQMIQNLLLFLWGGGGGGEDWCLMEISSSYYCVVILIIILMIHWVITHVQYVGGGEQIIEVMNGEVNGVNGKADEAATEMTNGIQTIDAGILTKLADQFYISSGQGFIILGSFNLTLTGLSLRF